MVYVIMISGKRLQQGKTLLFFFFIVFNMSKILATLQLKVGKTVGYQDHDLNNLPN